ncbi:MAG: zf-TFIIB domain-containing protein [Deltaproteobacteria bacterium]|nr:zf-TFIIB domain-containing protein [Deltaproteobacteria bacterium]
MITIKTGSHEEEYFAKQQIEQKKKLASELKTKLENAERKRLKDLHYMNCPKCGLKLEELVYKGVVVDKCFSCGVVVLDDGELEKILGEDSSFLKSISNLFK